MGMKTYIVLTACSLALAGAALTQGDTFRFAVAPFECLNAGADELGIGDAAARHIEQSMSASPHFALRKRGEIAAFLENLTLAQAGLKDTSSVEAAGKGLKITHLTVGSVALIGGRYEVDARSVNIDNWTIIHSSGCGTYSIDSACSYICRDTGITLTGENLAARETAAKDSPTISVFRFGDSNPAAYQAGISGPFAEILNSELGALGDIAVIERTNLKPVINEKALEMAGVIENDNSAGYFNVRGIAYKLDGEIRAFSDIISVAYRISNTGNARTIHSGYAEVGNTEALRGLARRIARETADAINKRTGTLAITTNPSGPELFIDGEGAGRAPLTLTLKTGRHTVKAVTADYEPASGEIEVLPGKTVALALLMERISQRLLQEAFAFEQKNDWEAALGKYQEFIDRYGESETANMAYYRKGHILQFYLKRNDDAVACFEALIGRYPDAMTRAEAYLGLARTYRSMGNEERALTIVRTLVDKFPDSLSTEEAKIEFRL